MSGLRASPGPQAADAPVHGPGADASQAPAPLPAAAAAGAPAYTRAERIADAAIHCLGVTLALMAAPVLVTLALMLDGRGPVVAGVTIYGLGLLLMLGCSAAYHLVPVPRWREVLRRLDHAAIYVKIAATQTPFALMIGGAAAGWLLGGVWTAALGGAAAKLFRPRSLRRLALPLYLALGWAGAVLVWPWGDGAALSGATVALVVIGGLTYSAGVVFLLWERLRFHNAIWHGFVLAASCVFYAAIASEMGLRAAAAP